MSDIVLKLVALAEDGHPFRQGVVQSYEEVMKEASIEIKRLREESQGQRQRIREAASRIEELEQIEKYNYDSLKALMQDDGKYIITAAQIDAAWIKIQAAAKHYGWDHEITRSLLAILEPLGIVRCPNSECRRGVIQHLETPLEPGDDYGWNQRCPDCNGPGWVKEADNE